MIALFSLLLDLMLAAPRKNFKRVKDRLYYLGQEGTYELVDDTLIYLGKRAGGASRVVSRPRACCQSSPDAPHAATCMWAHPDG